MKYYGTPRYLLLMVSLFLVIDGSGQTEWKNWNGVNLDFALSKKAGIGVSHLRSYIITDSYRNNFNQWGIDLDYRITKRFAATAGYRLTYYPLNSVSTSRFQLRGAYTAGLGKRINWINGFQAEVHSASEERFDYRVIYQTRFSLQRRLRFMRLAPSVSYWLYYNGGGNPIQYYDDSGIPLRLHSPDGLHRGRFIINLNSKISNNLAISAYYINQTEFNLSGNDMNVSDPASGKIVRPFDNFHVAGLRLSLDFELYRKASDNTNSLKD